MKKLFVIVLIIFLVACASESETRILNRQDLPGDLSIVSLRYIGPSNQGDTVCAGKVLNEVYFYENGVVKIICGQNDIYTIHYIHIQNIIFTYNTN
jgi:hypothetical protein